MGWGGAMPSPQRQDSPRQGLYHEGFAGVIRVMVQAPSCLEGEQAVNKFRF
jgi:hypothetical protein